MLAGTIGSRPVGTPENARARQYIVDQLRLYGFDVRVQETDARRPELGRTAHVQHHRVRAGTERAAIGLLSHYDSRPEAPGAADDGFGVAVSLEAARVLAARPDRRHTLMVLVTDGEEAGPDGRGGSDRGPRGHGPAAGLRQRRSHRAPAARRCCSRPGRATAGSSSRGRAPRRIRAAPRSRSKSIDRLPNDTDFSILKRHDIPGLNFAPVGDSYAYHTARDTADRLSTQTLQRERRECRGNGRTARRARPRTTIDLRRDLLRHRRNGRADLGTRRARARSERGSPTRSPRRGGRAPRRRMTGRRACGPISSGRDRSATPRGRSGPSRAGGRRPRAA